MGKGNFEKAKTDDIAKRMAALEDLNIEKHRENNDAGNDRAHIEQVIKALAAEKERSV